MAEAIAVEVAMKIIEIFGSMTYKNFVFVKDLDSNIERLRQFKPTIARALQRVDPLKESDDVQGPIIARLRRLHADLVTYLDEHEELMSSSKITKVCASVLSRKRFENIMKQLKDFESDYAVSTSITASLESQCTSFVEDTGPIPDTDVFIGREKDMENIIKMLCNSSNDHISPFVVAIVGLGGQGKTTLAQFVCKDDRVRASFGIPLWVSAAPGSSVKEILEKIVASATGKNPCYFNKEHLQRSVLDAIVGEKRLLVLDNIWYHGNLGSDWLELRALLKEVDFEAKGSKILITTRQKEAARLMGIPSPYELRDLAEDDCWKLLRRLALVQEQQLDVEEIGKEIAKMCPKLPLVIKVVGLQLAQKDTIRQWKKFKDEFASTSTLYMQNNEIRPILKLCYDQLSDENLKSCLVYCSLFPKGHRYSTSYMARHWMALEFLKPEDELSLEEVGEELVKKLGNLGFFVLDELYGFKYFKMHDVMHDLVRRIGEPTHQVINSETKKISNGVRYVSLNVKELNWEVLKDFRGNLESIISVSDHGKHCSIRGLIQWSSLSSSRFEEFLWGCKRLKILEVPSRGIEKVPNSISQMYLNYSRNPLRNIQG